MRKSTLLLTLAAIPVLFALEPEKSRVQAEMPVERQCSVRLARRCNRNRLAFPVIGLVGVRDHDVEPVDRATQQNHDQASPALIEALHAHLDAAELEGQVKQWTPEQRRLVFPNTVGRITHYGQFLENVWQPLLAKAGLP